MSERGKSDILESVGVKCHGPRAKDNEGPNKKHNVPLYMACVIKPVFHSVLSSKVHRASHRIKSRDGNLGSIVTNPQRKNSETSSDVGRLQNNWGGGEDKPCNSLLKKQLHHLNENK